MSKTKKKVAKKKAKKAARRKARPVDAAERKLQAEVAEVRVSAEDVPPVCAAFNCYESVADHGDLCAKHAPAEPHVVSEPSTAEEIAASDNAIIRKYVAQAPEKHTYVPPEPAPRPVLPDLTQRTLEFHTPPGRRGMYVDVAFALLLDEGVVIRRTTDRLIGAGSVRYSVAGVGDLDTVQCLSEIASHYWHDASDEEETAIAKEARAHAGADVPKPDGA